MSSETNATKADEAPQGASRPQSPIDQVKADIAALEAEREQLSERFQAIEESLKDKRKQVDVWTMVMADAVMQAKLLEQIKAAGLGV